MAGSDDSDVGSPTLARSGVEMPLRGPAANLPVPAVDKSLVNASIDARSELDRRIAAAPIAELPALLQARGAIIEQDEYLKEGAHVRHGQKGVFYSKIGFSIAAAVGGTTLIVAGFGLPGFFLLGGAAAVYVPEYVKNAISQFKPGGGDA